jgi:4-amino-4-deoxy-L-arabinose transferase-like glycosyltransferase
MLCCPVRHQAGEPERHPTVGKVNNHLKVARRRGAGVAPRLQFECRMMGADNSRPRDITTKMETPLFLRSSPALRLGTLMAICGMLFFAFLGVRDIWDIDEGEHAAMAQTMLLSGDWITPVFNGIAFFDKPALFNWLNAFSFKLFGFTEFAARLPAALAGLGCVILAWQLGRRLFGEKAGFLAGLILATSLEFMILSRVVQYDIPFTFFVTLSLFCFAMGVHDPGKRRLYFICFYAAAALAVLTKGPIGVILPGMIVVIYLATTRRFHLLKEIQILPGIVIFITIVTPWFVLMEQANDGYLRYFILKQHLGNFLGGEGIMSPRHPEPFYYYVPILLAGLLPWSALLPQSVIRGWQSSPNSSSELSRFLVIWVLATFVFFSAATSKLSTYLLPVFPACAILIGHYLSEFLENPRPTARRGWIIGVVCWLIPISLLTAYAIPNDPWTYWDHKSGVVWQDFEFFIVMFSVLLLTTLILIVFRKNVAAIASAAATTPILAFFILFVVVPGANPYKGAKEISMQIDYILQDDQKIPMYGQLVDSALFYTRRKARMIDSEKELKHFLDSPKRRFVLMRSRARTEADTFKGDYHVILRIGNKAIVSNQPATRLLENSN